MDLLSGLVLGPLLVKEVQSSGLNLTVDKGTSESSQDLLGLCVALGLAYYRQKEVSAFLCLLTWLCVPNGHQWGEGDGCICTVLSNVVLVGLGGLVAGGTGDQLVDHGRIVLLLAVVGVVGLSLIGVV